MRIEPVIAAPLLWALACSSAAEPTGKTPPRVVKCAPVIAGSARTQIALRGTIAPLASRDAIVAAQVSGRVLRVEVREGDSVTRGQILARMDEAALRDMAHQADAALAKAKAQEVNAHATLERARQVFAHGIVARQEVDDATAKQAAAGAAVATAIAEAQSAHRQQGRALLRSPMDGIVLRILRRPGELVDGTSATAVAQVADISVLELVADVPARDLVRLVKGASATLRISAFPDREFKGRVERVSPAVDPASGVGAVRVRLLDLAGAHPPVGAYGVAHIATGAPRPVVIVPAAALRASIGGEAEVVVCGADGIAHVRTVRPFVSRGGVVDVIAADLKGGERVAIDPVIGIGDGDAIEAAP